MEFDPVKLNNLYNIPGSKNVSKRVGRGIGSGKGKTAGRGTKGKKTRAGVAIKGFEGGQMPIIARLPKRGFNPIKRFRYNVISIDMINHFIEFKLVQDEQIIDKDFLVNHGIIKSINVPVKLLGNSQLNAKLKFELDAYSDAAKGKVLEAGGEVK